MRVRVRVWVIAGLLVTAVAFAQTAAPARKIVDLPSPLDQTYPEILKQISELRRLPWKEQVAALVQKRDALRKHLIELVDRDIPPEKLAGREMALRKMGLYEEEQSMRDLLLDAYTSQMAGFYDPSKKTLYILDDLLLLSTDIIAHEMVHALQDQHYDLESLPMSDMANSDLALALMALIEGDATIAMVRFMEKRLGMPTSTGEDLIERIGREMGMSVRFMDLPDWFKEEMVFPYIEGTRFVSTLMSVGGWDRVDRAFEDLPLSTEQIIHAEKYLDAGRDDPQAVAIPDLVDSLGGACKEVFSDSMGELGMRILLRKHAPAFAEKAAAGWDGDRAVAYESEDGNVTLAMVSVWDDSREAREFQLAMLHRTLTRDERMVRAGASADGRGIILKSPEDTVFLERRGAHVIFVAGAPAGRIESVRRTLWQSEFSDVTEVTRTAPR